MYINYIVVGKTGKDFLSSGEDEYLKRLKRYIKVNRVELPDVKNAKNKTVDQLKEEEGKAILSKIENGGRIILLDENGKSISSKKFAYKIQQSMNQGLKHITFVVGGPYGFSDEVYNKADEMLSLSKMTFSHQMIRMFFVEQLYRAFTIMRNEPYHHE